MHSTVVHSLVTVNLAELATTDRNVLSVLEKRHRVSAGEGGPSMGNCGLR